MPGTPTKSPKAPAATELKKVESNTNDDKKSESTGQHLVTYNGETYDVFPYLDKHPGGRAVLLKYGNKDITKAFDRVGHSEFAKTTMAAHRVKKGQEGASVKPSFKNHKVDYGFVKRKLFTEEDKNNVHKTFGFLSLLSFVYRYFYVLPTTGTLGFTGTAFDWLSLGIHFMLTFSSLIFHVVEHRILSNPLIIYEEYRLHAILFTGRAIFVSIFGLYQHHFTEVTGRWVLGLSILAIHLAVDYVTKKHGTPGITAVRVNNDGTIREIKLFFAFYQVLAMSSHLIVDPMLCDLGWNAVVAIQSSAFLMTLKRKSIIRSRSHLFWYSLALFLSMTEIYLVKGPMWYAMVAAMFYLKVKFDLNKYLMWTVFTFGVYLARSPDAMKMLGLSALPSEL